ncbi:dual specificity protein kinase splA [Dorcoceras hygrometricum]|uniref:Dual specificity protein kinase splA n=1 Tax=Dorcoceras hygrometricum TaxID=472368 RepID=A0A2Z7C4F5_9LAMI|nr:dual specificity protein kinase splA [Dorcoceras hygrometricum]
MDIQKGLPLNWPYFYQEKSMDELRHSLVLTMELEETRLKAQEELRNRDEHILQLRLLLNRAIEERDGAKERCQNVFFEKLMLQQQLAQQCHQSAPHSGISGVEDDPRRNGLSSSDSDDSIVSSPPVPEQDFPLVPDRPLPEKGKLLQAVMKAGPLLQTLLLAGPLPRWRHPPPPLDTYQIPPPPVVISPPLPLPSLMSLPSIYQDSLTYDIDIDNNVSVNRKRGLSEGSDTSTELKHQKVFFLNDH